VDDAMVDYDTHQRQRQKLVTVVEDSQIALDNAQRQYIAGAIDFLNVLTVQQALLDAQQSLVISNTNVSMSLVRLYKALGGGWEKAYPGGTV
jgi:outer membrane protein TolC